MKKHDYRVKLESDFVESASSPRQLRIKLLNVIRRAGLAETNFTISIEREERTARYDLNESEKALLGLDKPLKGRAKLSVGRMEQKPKPKRGKAKHANRKIS